MKEPIVTPKIAETFVRLILANVEVGTTLQRGTAVHYLPDAFTHKATWTFQKETAEMLLYALVGAGLFEVCDNHTFQRIR